MDWQDEYEDLLRYAVVTPKVETITSAYLHRLSTSHLSAEGQGHQRKDGTKSPRPAGISLVCKPHTQTHTHSYFTKPFWQKPNLSLSRYWPYQMISCQKGFGFTTWRKMWCIFLYASYFQLVNQCSQDTYDISLSDCTPHLFPLRYPHLKQSIGPPHTTAPVPVAALIGGLVL